MKKKNKRSKVKRELGIQRSRMISDGYYDGRFRPKVYKNKKKDSKTEGLID